MQCNDDIDFKRSRNTGTAVQGRPMQDAGVFSKPVGPVGR